MSHPNKNFVNRSVPTFFLFSLVAFISCSPASKSASATKPSRSPEKTLDVYFRDTLSQGIALRSGNGSQEDPFKILIDESVSLRGYPLELSELFSNVVSMEETAKSGEAQLDATATSIKPSLGSKLSIKLNGSNDEKYAELYFQDSARLTEATQSGAAVLNLVDRGKIAQDSEVTVTIYKKNADDTSWSVDLESLFDYDKKKFDVIAYEDGDARFSQDAPINISNYTITEAETVQLVFTPKARFDSLLYPQRSQLLNLTPDTKVMSSLDFKDSAWQSGSKWSAASQAAHNQGESPEDARVLESVWDEALNLLSYVEADNSETLTVLLYEADNLDLIPPTGGTISEGAALKLPEFGTGKCRFNITGESASATFEFSTPHNGNIFGKKIYLKVAALKKESDLNVLSTLPNERTSTGTGVDFDTAFVISGSFAANTAVDLRTLVDEASASDAAHLHYAIVIPAPQRRVVAINNPAQALAHQAGTSVVVRVVDSGSEKVKAKTIFLKLTFAKTAGTFGLKNPLPNGRTSSGSGVDFDNAFVMSATFPDNTTVDLKTLVDENSASAAANLTYTTVTSDIDEGALISNASLAPQIAGTSVVVKVVDSGSEKVKAKTIFLKLTFATPTLKPNPNYNITDQDSSPDKPILVPEIAQGASLTLTDLIEPYSGTVTYVLSRKDVAETFLDSGVTSLSIGQNPIDHVGPWFMKVSATSATEGTTEELYFQLTFAKNAATLVKNSDYSTTSGTGSSADSYRSTVAANASLTLAHLISGQSSGALSYSVDDTATTASSLKVGVNGFIAGTKNIVVSDAGDHTTEGRSLYFQITFALNAATLVKNSDYSTTSGTGSSTDPYLATVAANTSLTLADLTSGQSSGALSYTVDAAATTASSLKVGVNGFIAGTKNIVVSDAGDKVTEGRSLYFQITFALNAATLVKNSDYSTTSGTGSSANPYRSTVAAGVTLTLVHLTSGQSSAALSYTVDDTTTTASSLKVGVNGFIAGTKNIVVSDAGDHTTEARSLYFQITFALNAATLVKNSDYSTTSGTGSSTDPYLATVAANTSLTLADLISGQSSGALSYTVDAAVTTATSLQVGVNGFTAGTKTIVVSDAGDHTTEGRSLYFQITFALNAATLVKNSDYSTTSGTGSSTDPYLATVAANTSLTLAHLTSGQSSGALSYTVDDAATTATILKVGVNGFIAGTKNIVVSDAGDHTTEGRSLYFQITFALNAATLVKNSDYSTTSGTGSSTDPYLATVAANTSLTLADLTSGQSSGALSYTVDDTTTTASSLKVGVGGFTAGTKNIVVSDAGDKVTEGRSLYFQITFALNAATLVKNSDYSTTSGTGSSANPYRSTVAAGVTLTLADLTSGQSSAALSYTVDAAVTTASSLKVGVNGFIAGTKNIVVSDAGDKVTEGRSLYFQITFALNAATLIKNSDYSTTSGTGSNADPYRSTVAANTSLNLADLTTGSVGALSYTVDDTTTTASSLKVGVNGFTAGTKNIVVSDEGDKVTEGRSLYFQITFALNAATLVKNSDYSTTSGTGSSTDPYLATVAANTSLTLAHLTSGQSSAALSYTVDDTTTTASSLQVGVNGFTAGTKTIVVSDAGDHTTEGRSLYFQITFALNAATLVKNSDYSTTSGTGSNADPYRSTVAAGGTLNLADLTTGSVGALSYTVDAAATTATSLQVGVGGFTAGTKNIVVSDAGDDVTAGSSLYFQITFALNAATLVKNNDYSTTSGTGSNADPYRSTVAAGVTLNLADLITGSVGTLSYSVDDTITTVSSLQVGVGGFTAGTKNIVVSDEGDDVTAGSSLYFQITFALNAATLVKNSDYSTTSGTGSSTDPYLATVAANASLTLADLTSGQSSAALSYTVDAATTTATSLQVGVGGFTAGTKNIVVSDEGDDFTAAETIYFKVNFLPLSSAFAFEDQLPSGYSITGSGANFANAAILKVNGGTLPANTAVDLTAFFKGFAAIPADRVYETVTSASDQSPGSITSPASALNNQAGKSVLVKVTDPGSTTVTANTLYLSLAFATVPPTQDNRYTAVALRSGGPEVQLTGSMTAGEISFSVELLPNKEQVIYSSRKADKEFKYLYKKFDEQDDDYDLVLFSSQDDTDYTLKEDLPAGVYNFTLVKTPSNNGYTVALSVTDSNSTLLVFDPNNLTNNNTIEITNSNVRAFSNPVIGADFDDARRRAVRVVNNVQWAFQPTAPQVSLFGGNDFSSLRNDGATVGSDFVVRVPDLVAGDRLELFSVTGSTSPVSIGTKTVATGESWLEFEVSNLIHGTSYEFLVKPADSSANLLDSPRSVAVSVDTSVPATTALFVGANGFPVSQNQVVNGFAGLTVDPVADAFEVGDRIFLYEIKNNERVGVGNATGLAHTFTTENLVQSLTLDLSGVAFEERAYALVVELVTPLGNKSDSNFTFTHGEAADRVFDITFDFTAPQLSFDFTDASNLVISANEALAQDRATNITNGLSFMGTDSNPRVSRVTYDTHSGAYHVQLSRAVSAGAVLNLVADAVSDVAGNGNISVEESLPHLLNIVASSKRIGGSSNSTTLTFSFAQKIDAATFSPAADLEIVDAHNMALSDNVPTLSNVFPNTGASQTISVTLTAANGFDRQVRVRMKTANQISLPGTSLTAAVTGESPLIDIDLKAPTPKVSFATNETGLSTAIQFMLHFDEAVTGNVAATDFQIGAGGTLSNIRRTDQRTFTGTLTTPANAVANYSLILQANTLTDTYANNNSASAAATINVLNDAVPIPSFSAPPFARHGGSTTLSISFPEEVTGFALEDLSVTDGVSLGATLDRTANNYTLTLSTQSTWLSHDVTVSVAAGAYQDPATQKSSPALTYTIPVDNTLSSPALVSVTDAMTVVDQSSDTETLLLSGTSVKVNVSAVKDDTLLLFLGEQMVATHPIATTGTATIDITDPSSKVNGSRLAYSVRLQDAQGNSSKSSRLLYVSFDDPNAPIAPKITGPVTNVSFTDDFSSSETNWAFRHGRALGFGKPSTLPGSAAISNGVLQLNDARTWQYALVTQNDLIFSTQGRVVFEATFIFGNSPNPADGIAFFSYDAGDELFHEGRAYSGNGALVVTNGRLRSLFFAIGLDEHREDSIGYAAPAANPADLSNLANPTAGNTSKFSTQPLPDIWANARHRLRITVENRSVLVERANVNTHGVVDENSWQQMLQRHFTPTAYIPDNIKIGFSAATGAAMNYHAVDNVSVNAELFVPYTVGATPVQASPSGITLIEGEKTDSSSLAISGIRVRINSGYQAADNLSFSGNSTLFTPTLAGDRLSIRAATGQSPSTDDFLAALNAINFSTTAEGLRTLSWQVFAEDAGSELFSQSYSSEIRVSSAN